MRQTYNYVISYVVPDTMILRCQNECFIGKEEPYLAPWENTTWNFQDVQSLVRAKSIDPYWRLVSKLYVHHEKAIVCYNVKIL